MYRHVGEGQRCIVDLSYDRNEGMTMMNRIMICDLVDQVCFYVEVVVVGVCKGESMYVQVVVVLGFVVVCEVMASMLDVVDKFGELIGFVGECVADELKESLELVDAVKV